MQLTINTLILGCGCQPIVCVEISNKGMMNVHCIMIVSLIPRHSLVPMHVGTSECLGMRLHEQVSGDETTRASVWG